MTEIDQKEEKVQKPFNQDPEKEKRWHQAWSNFLLFEIERNQTVRFLNKEGVARNIIDYVRDSVDRMNEYNPMPAYKDDWQSNIFDPQTRNALIAILATLASTRAKTDLILKPTSIFANTDLKEKKRIFGDLLDNANEHNNDSLEIIWEMYSAMSEGTYIGFEGWKKGRREVPFVTDFDPDTGKKTTTKIVVNEFDDVYGERVPINEFYPETIWVNNVSKLKRAFRVRDLNKSQFLSLFGKYPNADKVEPAGFFKQDEGFEWGISESVPDDHYQVVEWYDALKGEMGIWSNGVELYWGCMPWNHGRLPFWSAIFEIIHPQFLYGKSFPDKMMSLQDTDNTLLNAMLDQVFLGLNKPIFVAGESSFDDGYFEPGRIYNVDEGTTVSTPNIGTIDQAAQVMRQNILQSIEETGISAQARGVPTGGRKTKYEVQALQEGANKLAGLFQRLFEEALKDKYWLRMHNILQYYTFPSNTESGKTKFKFIVLENRKLLNNKRGTSMIQIVGSEKEQLSPKELMAKQQEGETEPFNPLTAKKQIVVITTDWLKEKEFDLEVRIVPNSSVKETQADITNKALSFYQLTANDPNVDPLERTKKLAEVFDQPPEVVREPQPDQMNQLLQGLGNNPQPQANAQLI
ncbi:MAG: hypothetical protein H6743_03970 [Rickettsiaceae bacterium]|nr:hypothetical protein [Rickettsiaceae bacterium]